MQARLDDRFFVSDIYLQPCAGGRPGATLLAMAGSSAVDLAACSLKV